MTPETNWYKSFSERPFDSFYLFFEATIDAPVERIWPIALDIGRWMDASRLETVSGEAGKVGHLVRVHPPGLSDSVPIPHHHLYGLSSIVPHKLIALEVFLENGGSYGKTREKVSCDTIYFTDTGRHTVVAYHLIDVHFGQGDDEFRARRQRELDSARPTIEGFLENLKRLVIGASTQSKS